MNTPDNAETAEKKKRNRRTREHIKFARGNFAQLIAYANAQLATRIGTPEYPLLAALLETLAPIGEDINRDNVMLEVTVSY